MLSHSVYGGRGGTSVPVSLSLGNSQPPLPLIPDSAGVREMAPLSQAACGREGSINDIK